MPSGNHRPSGSRIWKVNPIVTVLLGMGIALGVFVALYVMEFRWIHLAWCLPALALAALLVFGGARKLRGK